MKPSSPSPEEKNTVSELSLETLATGQYGTRFSRRSFMILSTSAFVGGTSLVALTQKWGQSDPSSVAETHNSPNNPNSDTASSSLSVAVKIQLDPDEHYSPSFIRYSEKATFKSVAHALAANRNPNVKYRLVPA